jgi:hypothetical protein
MIRKGLKPRFKLGFGSDRGDQNVWRFRRSWVAISILAVMDIIFLIPAVATYMQLSGGWSGFDSLFNLVGTVFLGAPLSIPFPAMGASRRDASPNREVGFIPFPSPRQPPQRGSWPGKSGCCPYEHKSIGRKRLKSWKPRWYIPPALGCSDEWAGAFSLCAVRPLGRFGR